MKNDTQKEYDDIIFKLLSAILQERDFVLAKKCIQSNFKRTNSGIVYNTLTK